MNRRLVVLGSLALLLGLVLLLDRSRSPAPPEPAVIAPSDGVQPAAPQGSGAASDLNPLAGLDAESFTAMLGSPLFNPGRAPRPQELPPEPPPPAEPPPPEMPIAVPGPNAGDFVLVAIAGGPSGRVAAVRSEATGEVLYLREGQPLETWQVMSVGDRTVVIGTPESNVELKLFDEDVADMADPAVFGMPQDGAMPPPEEVHTQELLEPSGIPALPEPQLQQ